MADKDEPTPAELAATLKASQEALERVFGESEVDD